MHIIPSYAYAARIFRSGVRAEWERTAWYKDPITWFSENKDRLTEKYGSDLYSSFWVSVQGNQWTGADIRVNPNDPKRYERLVYNVARQFNPAPTTVSLRTKSRLIDPNDTKALRENAHRISVVVNATGGTPVPSSPPDKYEPVLPLALRGGSGVAKSSKRKTLSASGKKQVVVVSNLSEWASWVTSALPSKLLGAVSTGSGADSAVRYNPRNKDVIRALVVSTATDPNVYEGKNPAEFFKGQGVTDPNAFIDRFAVKIAKITEGMTEQVPAYFSDRALAADFAKMVGRVCPKQPAVKATKCYGENMIVQISDNSRVLGTTPISNCTALAMCAMSDEKRKCAKAASKKAIRSASLVPTMETLNRTTNAHADALRQSRVAHVLHAKKTKAGPEKNHIVVIKPDVETATVSSQSTDESSLPDWEEDTRSVDTDINMPRIPFAKLAGCNVCQELGLDSTDPYIDVADLKPPKCDVCGGKKKKNGDTEPQSPAGSGDGSSSSSSCEKISFTIPTKTPVPKCAPAPALIEVTIPVEISAPECVSKEVTIPVDVPAPECVSKEVTIPVEIPPPKCVSKEATIPVEVPAPKCVSKDATIPVEVPAPECAPKEVTIPVEVPAPRCPAPVPVVAETICGYSPTDSVFQTLLTAARDLVDIKDPLCTPSQRSLILLPVPRETMHLAFAGIPDTNIVRNYASRMFFSYPHAESIITGKATKAVNYNGGVVPIDNRVIAGTPVCVDHERNLYAVHTRATPNHFPANS